MPPTLPKTRMSSTESTFRQETMQLWKLARCLLAIILVSSLLFPTLWPRSQALADSSPTPACNLTWDELKPHLESGLGVPYLFGGATKSGWDCSGYVSWAFNTYGGTNYTHYTTTFENDLGRANLDNFCLIGKIFVK